VFSKAPVLKLTQKKGVWLYPKQQQSNQKIKNRGRPDIFRVSFLSTTANSVNPMWVRIRLGSIKHSITGHIQEQLTCLAGKIKEEKGPTDDILITGTFSK